MRPEVFRQGFLFGLLIFRGVKTMDNLTKSYALGKCLKLMIMPSPRPAKMGTLVFLSTRLVPNFKCCRGWLEGCTEVSSDFPEGVYLSGSCKS